MLVGVPRELGPVETRAAASPESVGRLTKAGMRVLVEAGVGAGCRWDDELYRAAGAEVTTDRRHLLESAEVLLRVRAPSADEVAQLRPACVAIGFLDPFGEPGLVRTLADRRVTAISLELVPRTTRAQKMDALSSQHSIAGYFMVVLAAERLGKVLPMMSTPSGVIQPARVLVIGAGVAGLQAIATAKRLGARVEAFDTRPVVKEQVESLGARFVEIDLGETGQTEGGYAKELSAEQKARQQTGLADACARADIVITTAQLFGKRAPVVVTAAMLARMKPGAVVVDYAVESGGNVEGSRPGEEVELGGVRVIGMRNYPGRVAVDASRMLASNLAALVEELWDKEARALKVDLSNEILAGCVVTHGGEVVHPLLKQKEMAS